MTAEDDGISKGVSGGAHGGTHSGVIAGKTGDEWLALLGEVAAAIRESLVGITDWRKPGNRSWQYALDLVADAAALEVLQAADVAVLSEESGVSSGAPSGVAKPNDNKPGETGEPIVIVDPVDGSTNASREIPYFSTSLCVMVDAAFQVGLVMDLSVGTQWSAIASEGAWCDGLELSNPGHRVELSDALVVSNGALPSTVKCGQTRTLGSAALDLCGVASGRFDAFIDPSRALHVWDYAAGVLICQEAGMAVSELGGEPLTHTDPERSLGPIAAVDPQLLTELVQVL